MPSAKHNSTMGSMAKAKALLFNVSVPRFTNHNSYTQLSFRYRVSSLGSLYMIPIIMAGVQVQIQVGGVFEVSRNW